jgi:hypothetical protein
MRILRHYSLRAYHERCKEDMVQKRMRFDDTYRVL